MNDLVKLSEIFDVIYGVNLELVHIEQCTSTTENAIPFVSRTEKNNGVSAYVYEMIDVEPNPKHTLSVAGGGSVLSTFYQPKPYYSGRDLYVLIPKKELSVVEMLFYTKCISSNKYKYSYGRQANKTMKDLLIPKNVPNQIIKKLSNFKTDLELNLKQKPVLDKKLKLDIDNWKLFPLLDLFTITGSKTTPKQELEEIGSGMFPNVTTQATNNGVDNFYDVHTEDGNVLTVDSAVLGYCSFQPLKFSASDHVEKLIPKFEMNNYIAMFFVTIMNLEKYRYNYGRKASQTRMKTISIKLPEKNGKPNFSLMEKYIKSLPYSKSL
ncbi:MAG: restriction endonuclease subunit S [Flavobacteriaceae bacterium]|nr:restriction endonuclease subunit S [Flavobacteriaceae bacterium]